MIILFYYLCLVNIFIDHIFGIECALIKFLPSYFAEIFKLVVFISLNAHNLSTIQRHTLHKCNFPLCSSLFSLPSSIVTWVMRPQPHFPISFREIKGPQSFLHLT